MTQPGVLPKPARRLRGTAADGPSSRPACTPATTAGEKSFAIVDLPSSTAQRPFKQLGNFAAVDQGLLRDQTADHGGKHDHHVRGLGGEDQHVGWRGRGQDRENHDQDGGPPWRWSIS